MTDDGAGVGLRDHDLSIYRSRCYKRSYALMAVVMACVVSASRRLRGVEPGNGVGMRRGTRSEKEEKPTEPP